MKRLIHALPLLFVAACSSEPEVASQGAEHPAMEDEVHQASSPALDSDAENHMTDTPQNTRELATFGAGCYWCVEAVYEQLEGVEDVTSGFMGGHVKDPAYREVVTGRTGHAEVVQVTFDPSVISYETLVDWFWRLHDPTTLNRQGADVGTQYRSAIFYHSEAQRETAEASMKAAGANFSAPIVTEISEASEYYEAKGDHQDFYRNNKTYGYCRAVIVPKLDKLGLEK